MEIFAIREREAELKDGLLDGGKAMFYFFAEELDKDEVVFAAESCCSLQGRGEICSAERSCDQRA